MFANGHNRIFVSKSHIYCAVNVNTGLQSFSLRRRFFFSEKETDAKGRPCGNAERHWTMDAWDVYETGPPCASRAVDGFVRIGMGGVAWGIFMGSYDATKEGHRGPSRALYVAKSMLKNGLGWGIFAGTYMGLSCGVETVRRKRDWVNASVAGAVTGAMASARSGSGLKILGTAALTSAVATAGDYFRPAQYPPTGI